MEKEVAVEAEEDLEDMFAGLVKSKAERRAAAVKKEKTLGEEASKKKPNGASPSRASGNAIRYTEDGLRVYTYDDIAADQPKGLNGPCPFDCSCCF